MSDTVIRAENLSKKYRLGVINRRQLVDQIESWVSRKTGRPDPHASIFEHATDRMPTPHDFWALKDVSFEIKKGDVVGVMGRNGSGKSTLLKILSRITAPTHGSAFLKGRLASLLEVGTGFNYELTGRENVYLNGSILGLKEREIRARYDSIVEFAEIADFMDTPVKRYSSGMRVRLAFAVAAHLEPDILILDEVLAVGDAKFQEKCLNRIDEIKNSGVTVLFVSHSVQQVSKLCTKGILLHEGRVSCTGSVKKVTDVYMEMLNITRKADVDEEYSESHVGLYAAQLGQFFAGYFNEGRLVVNAPVETPEGVFMVDVGWVSESRVKTLRTEPTWSAAPDFCVSIESSHGRLALVNEFLKLGAREAWSVSNTGTITRFTNPGFDYLIKEAPSKLII